MKKDQTDIAPFEILASSVTFPNGGKYALELETGTTPVDRLVLSSDYEPNGYFWDGVAMILIGSDSDFMSKLYFNSEGGTFFVESNDKTALKTLAEHMIDYLVDEDKMKALLKQAEIDGTASYFDQ